MALDGTIAQVKRCAGVGHDLWVGVSTFDAGHCRVNTPLVPTDSLNMLMERCPFLLR